MQEIVKAVKILTEVSSGFAAILKEKAKNGEAVDFNLIKQNVALREVLGILWETVDNQNIRELEIPVRHVKGALSVESEVSSMPTCEFGLQRACDGRVWVCINGVAFIRFKPE